MGHSAALTLLRPRSFLVKDISIVHLACYPVAGRSHFLSADPQIRKIHSNGASKRHSSSAVPVQDVRPQVSSKETPVASSALSCLPLAVLLRSYAITLISSTPALLTPSLKLLSIVANSTSPLLDPDRNFLLRAIIKHTIYKQFCAGTNAAEVSKTLAQLKDMGFTGAILGYAREVVMDESEVGSMNTQSQAHGEELKEKDEVSAWEVGTLKTIEMAEPGDFVALKFTGAGRRALSQLGKNNPPTPVLEEAIVNVCEKAKEFGVRLLFDAEQAALQDGIDAWTLDFMQRYNKPGGLDGDRALVYGTYQAYRVSTPGTIATHIQKAKDGGWRLGVKLVRGAYLGSDPRHLFWPTKDATDKAYNSIAQSLIERKYGEILKPLDGSDDASLPSVDLVLAGHNSQSVNKAMAVRDEQALKSEAMTEMVYAQLMGMADHVSCALIQKARRVESESNNETVGDKPQTFKYIVWGTVGECAKYLLRRAQENRDAVERTVEGRKALGQELARRMGFTK